MNHIKKMKKIVISMLLIGCLTLGGVLLVQAATASSYGPTYVAGGSSYINWKFSSKNTAYTWDYYRWDSASPATGVTITGKRAVKGSDPREAYGRMSATYQGSSVLNDSIITWHRINNDYGITVH